MYLYEEYIIESLKVWFFKYQIFKDFNTKPLSILTSILKFYKSII